jgi:hypothetical protein
MHGETVKKKMYAEFMGFIDFWHRMYKSETCCCLSATGSVPVFRRASSKTCYHVVIIYRAIKQQMTKYKVFQ